MIKIWPKIWEKFEKFVTPTILGKKSAYENFYWFGSRMSGKTLNVFLAMWKIAGQHPRKKFNWVWSRDRVQQAQNTFFTLVDFINFLDLKFSAKKKSAKRLYFSKLDFVIKYKNLHIQVVPLQGKHNLAFKKGEKQAAHQLLGFSFPVCAARFFVFEEAYQTYAVSRRALQLAARFAPLRFNFYLFNNYSKISDIVEYVESKLPYDPKLMGELDVKNADDPIDKVAAQQQVFLKKEKNHIWRFNFLLLKKDGLLLPADEAMLWAIKEEDPARAGTVIYGKCGNPRKGLYGNSLKKIKWIDHSLFFQKINAAENWNEINAYVGIDIGYVHDDSSLVINLFDREHKEMITFDSLVIKTSKTNIDLNEQSKIFIEFIKKSIEFLTAHRQVEVFLFMTKMVQAQLSFLSWIKNKRLENTVKMYVFNKPPEILERVNFFTRKLAQNQVFFLSTPTNKILFEQFDGLEWTNQPHRTLRRVGRDDLVEAFEMSCTNAINGTY